MTAKLPANYIAARAALATCARIDECKKWEAKAAALKSYARQMKDSKLEEMAQRIRNRAIQRTGELLQQIEKQKTGPKKLKGPQSQKLFRHTAAKVAGLTPDQAKTAVQVAQLEKREADRMIEASPPATVKQLAAAGRKKRKPKPKPKPAPYRNEWADWTDAVEHLSALPGCGLEVLAERDRDEVPDLLKRCVEAIANLKLWKSTLEKINGRKASADNDASKAMGALQ
jgi:hypothetical protein